MKTAHEIITALLEDGFSMSQVKDALEDGAALAELGLTDDDQELIEEASALVRVLLELKRDICYVTIAPEEFYNEATKAGILIEGRPEIFARVCILTFDEEGHSRTMNGCITSVNMASE